jgi:hypothetical protein
MSTKNMSLKNMNSGKNPTKHRPRANQQIGTLRALILTGSVIATLVGTRLLALQETARPESHDSGTESVTIAVPAESSSISLPTIIRGAQIELKPIPQVVRPQLNPIARTRSSR